MDHPQKEVPGEIIASRPVSIMVSSRVYRGKYVVRGGMIMVTALGQSETTQTGRMSVAVSRGSLAHTSCSGPPRPGKPKRVPCRPLSPEKGTEPRHHAVSLVIGDV